MIIKGDSVAGGKRIADHVLRTDTNEKIKVLELRGVISEDVHGALLEMEAVASAIPNCKKPFYHASINTPVTEPLSEQQRTIAIDRLEKKLGLEGQPRVVVAHVKQGREHYHIAWSRIDMERTRVISDRFNYRKHEEVSAELAREFGHALVQGVHVNREGKARPTRTSSHHEMQQAERTALPVGDIKAHVKALWESSENGAAFQAALKDAGYTLAKGDRRDFVVVDFAGGVHSLTRATGVTAQHARERLADINRDALASVDDARGTTKKREQYVTADHFAAHTALIDALRLGGNQSMAKIQQVQLDRMKRRAEDAYRDRFANLSKDGAALKEKTEQQVARDGKQQVAKDILSSDAAQKGKGEREQERD